MRRIYRKLSKLHKNNAKSAAPHFPKALDIEKLEPRTLLNAALSSPPLDDSFNYVWTDTLGGPELDSPNDITVDNSGCILLTGIFEGTVDFDPDPLNEDPHTAVGNHDIFVTKLNPNGRHEWTVTFGGELGDSGQGIAVDAANNIYVTGGFFNTVDFDPGAQTAERTSSGDCDIFLTKLDPFGNFLDVLTFGDAGRDLAHDVAIDASGFSILTGEFTGTVDFDPSENTDEHTANANTDAFITKINFDGTYGWTQTFGGDGYESGVALALDSADSVYATGRFELAVDFDPRSTFPYQDTPKTSHGSFDFFLTKFNTFGHYSWTVTVGGDGWDESHGIAIDPDNNVFVTGEFSQTVDFDPSLATDPHTSNGNRDIFISKFTKDALYHWTQTIGGENGDYGRDLTADSSGNVYVAGDFENVVDFDPTAENDIHTSQGFSDVFLTQIKKDGAYGWTATSGGEDFERTCGVTMNAVRNIYLTGSFTLTADFDPTDQTDFHVSNGGTDIFLTNFDTNRPPTIADMTGTPDPVNRGDNLTLTTLGTTDVDESDAGVTQVLFYHDSNGNGQLDIDNDLFLGDGAMQDTQTWSWIGSSGMFPVGNNTFFAQAWDSDLGASIPASVTVRINDIPIINSLTDNPDPVIQSDVLTLTANDVTDSDGTIFQVEFYRDADHNGILGVEHDEFLGTGINNAGDWIWSGSTAGFPPTNNIYFARAQDNDFAWGIIAFTTGKVNILPTIDSLSDSPEPVTIDEPLDLTANNVIDSNGVITIVEFYRDANNNGVLDVAGDDFLGADVNGANGWTWNGLTTGFDIGVNQFFARAQDDDLAWSNIVTTTTRVNDQPTISFLSDNPDPVIQGNNLMLTANNVQDSDGSVTRVEFYRDANNNGMLDLGIDNLLTIDTNGADGWFWFGSTSGFPIAQNSYFARAQDNDGAWSDVRTATTTIERFSITAGLQNSRTVKFTDPDGSDVTLKLNNGSGKLTFNGNALRQEIKGATLTIIGKAELLDVQLQNSNAKTSLTVNAKNGDGQTTLAGLSGHTLGKLTGKTLDLIGDIDLNGSLSALTLDDIRPNVSITTNMPSAAGMKIKIDNIDDHVFFNLDDNVKNFQANTFDGGSLTSGSIQTLKIKQGSLGADVTTQLGGVNNLFAYNNITGDINSASFINKITSKIGGVSADSDITAHNGDINKISTAQTIAGRIISSNSILNIKTKAGGFYGEAHAQQNIGKIQAGDFQGAIVSAGQDINQIKAAGHINDTFLMAGYDFSTGNTLGLGDGNINKISGGGTFSGSFISASVLPPVNELQSVLPSVQPPYTGLGYLGNIGKVSFGALDQNATSDFGLYAAGGINPVKAGNMTYNQSDPQINFRLESFLG